MTKFVFMHGTKALEDCTKEELILIINYLSNYNQKLQSIPIDWKALARQRAREFLTP